MGLDAVEIIMAVEDRFGITILDSKAESMRTVGDLVALIRSRADAAASSRCLSLPAFLSLRRLIRDIVGDDCLRLRPSQLVVDRLSRAHRRRLWQRLPELFGSMPHMQLRRPKSIRWILVVLSFLLIAYAVKIAAIDWVMLPLTLLIAIALIILLHLATTWLRFVPPDNMATLGDITRKIVGCTAVTTGLDLPDDSAILEELRPIIANVLGINADEIVMHARFMEDLGVS